MANVDQTDPDPANDQGMKAVQVLGASGSNDGGGGSTASTGRDFRGAGAALVTLLLLGMAALVSVRRGRKGAHAQT